MKKFITLFTQTLLVSLFLSFYACSTSTEQGKPYKMAKEERMKEAMDHEIDRTIDPELDYVPYERLEKAKEYYSKQSRFKEKTSGAFANLQWSERGPNNIGGRTRAVLFLSATKVLAAGVTGGLWKSDDITASNPNWEPIGDFLDETINISCIAQDSANPNILYAGTGEAFGSVHRGTGIYKSTDTGATWSFLTSTSSSSSSDFGYIAKLLVDANGDVYAACKSATTCNAGGLMKSNNGGTSWTRVVGSFAGGGCVNAYDFVGADLERNPAGDIYYSSNGGVTSTYTFYGHIFISERSVHGSSTGNSGNWTDITPSGSWERIEMGVSQQTGSEVIYIACEGSASNDVTGIYYSSDKGANWTSRTVPTICDQGSNSVYTRSQAWYDQVVQIDPANDATVYIGGIDLLKSTNSGAAFTQITTWSGYWSAGGCSGSVPPVVHADQHGLFFNPFTANSAISSNDGGLYYSTNMNASVPSWTDKNTGYNVTQYYSVASHPSDVNYLIGGTQDNGTHKLTTSGVTSGGYVSGGDGGFCHISQANANYQISSYIYNSYYNTINGGSTGFVRHDVFGDNTDTYTGRFINPFSHDDANNKIFSAGSDNNLEVRSNTNTTTFSVGVFNLGFSNRMLTALTVSPNNTTTLYAGDDIGNVYKITSRGTTPVKSATWSVGSGYVSSIDVWKSTSGDDDSILVTLSSYGVNSIYYTANGTVGSPTWTDIDDNSTLQDMPVRWGLFDKNDNSKIFIATDLGVMGTDNINGNSTVWTMINNEMLPSVRVDQLAYDADDNLVAATHGRGIWETREPCNLNGTPPTAAGTYTSTYKNTDGTSECFCNDDGDLLLALDVTGSGAVIPANGVSLQIGATATTSWNNSGGIVTNADGGAIINRKWEVSPTTQPSIGTVKVTSYFTEAEYTALISALGSLTSPTTLTSPSQMQFYKLTSAGTFADPHASGATGIVYSNGTSASTSEWVYAAVRDYHSATFLVSSFSGGGGGGGGGGSPLPVNLLSFTAQATSLRTANLDWSTAQELNNDYFEIQRSYDGSKFESIGTVDGNSNSNDVLDYNYLDADIDEQNDVVYYRLNQVDYDGKNSLSDIRVINFENTNDLKVWPIPAKNIVNVSSDYRVANIRMYNNAGKEVDVIEKSSGVLDVSNYQSGIYFIEITTEAGKQVRKLIVD